MVVHGSVFKKHYRNACSDILTFYRDQVSRHLLAVKFMGPG